MFGNNPIRKPEKGDGSTLAVQHIFPTMQGEGPFSGTPSVFVRLGGCNLACTFCDTEFESFESMTIHAILDDVKRFSCANQAKLVVITGGEPFRQPIEMLCESLLTLGFSVQIETNGTLWREVPAEISIICSPKSSAPIRDDLLRRITALKFLLSAHIEAYGTVADVGQGVYNTPVYVQAMDEYDVVKNARNLAHAVAIAAREGYKLSLQTHKLVGIE